MAEGPGTNINRASVEVITQQLWPTLVAAVSGTLLVSSGCDLDHSPTHMDALHTRCDIHTSSAARLAGVGKLCIAKPALLMTNTTCTADRTQMVSPVQDVSDQESYFWTCIISASCRTGTHRAGLLETLVALSLQEAHDLQQGHSTPSQVTNNEEGPAI
jgi:hypothetical protein